MIVKTEELSRETLDWAVAKAEGYEVGYSYVGDILIHRMDITDYFSPSTNGSWAEIIIERERIATWACQSGWKAEHPKSITGYYDGDSGIIDMGIFDGWKGATMLEAAMRAYVRFKLGREVEIPDELVEITKDIL